MPLREWELRRGVTTTLGVQVAQLQGFHRRAVVTLCFSPGDGTYLASVGQDNDHSVAIYHWAREELLATYKGDPNPVLCIAWSHFDHTLVRSFTARADGSGGRVSAANNTSLTLTLTLTLTLAPAFGLFSRWRFSKPILSAPLRTVSRMGYSDAQVANRNLRVWHGATENGP